MSVREIKDMNVREIKAEIIENGYETELRGLTEKSHLIELLQKSRDRPERKDPPKRRVNTIILSEEHLNEANAITNATRVVELLMPDSIKMEKHKYLLVSEARGINPCYQALGLPVDRILEEHTAHQTYEEMIDKLLLHQDLVFDVAAGVLNDGNSMGSVDVVISKAWFLRRALHDGFQPLLTIIGNGLDLYNSMLDAAFARPIQIPTVNQIFKQILERIITIPHVDEHIKKILSELITTNRYTNYHNFSELLTYLREKRDEAIIRKIEERVRTEPGVKIVIIIFGAIHYRNLKSLIKRSDILNFNEHQSLTLLGYEKKYLKYKSKYLHLKKIYE